MSGHLLSSQKLARAFATVILELPASRRPAAARACARVLQRQRRLHDAPEILDAFEEIVLQQQGKKRAKISSPDALSAGAVRTLETLLRAFLKTDVAARVVVQPRLLAGFRVEVGDLLIDASLHGVLSRLRNEIRSWSPTLMSSAHG